MWGHVGGAEPECHEPLTMQRSNIWDIWELLTWNGCFELILIAEIWKSQIAELSDIVVIILTIRVMLVLTTGARVTGHFPSVARSRLSSLLIGRMRRVVSSHWLTRETQSLWPEAEARRVLILSRGDITSHETPDSLTGTQMTNI